jgi:hypothetical protein
VPPQNLEAEEAVLGAILLAGSEAASARVLAKIRETGLEAGDFYRASHGRILRAALDLDARDEPADVLTLAAELERCGDLEEAGGRTRLAELAAIVPATSNAAHYARLVRDKATARALLHEIVPLVEQAQNGGLDSVEATAALERAAIALAGSASSTQAGLEPLDLRAFLAGDPPAVPWLWQGWLARGDLALIVGDPGVGKSLLGLGLADALRRGADFLDDPCTTSRVGLFDLENPEAEAHARLRGFGLTADEHDGLYYFHAAGLDLSAGVSALARALNRYELDVAIVDSLRRAAPGLDENDARAVSAILSPLRALTATTGRTIALLHHARKRIGDNPTDAGQMVRGSGDLVASVDSLLFLRAKESGSFTLEHAKSRRGRPHEPLLVSFDDSDGAFALVSEGPLATADDKVEAVLSQIVRALGDDGGPLARQVLALRIGRDPKDGTFARALNLGWQRNVLAKSDRERVSDPLLYSLAEGVAT